MAWLRFRAVDAGIDPSGRKRATPSGRVAPKSLAPGPLRRRVRPQRCPCKNGGKGMVLLSIRSTKRHPASGSCYYHSEKLPNTAAQWRAACDVRYHTECESARPLKQHRWALSSFDTRRWIANERGISDGLDALLKPTFLLLVALTKQYASRRDLVAGLDK